MLRFFNQFSFLPRLKAIKFEYRFFSSHKSKAHYMTKKRENEEMYCWWFLEENCHCSLVVTVAHIDTQMMKMYIFNLIICFHDFLRSWYMHRCTGRMDIERSLKEKMMCIISTKTRPCLNIKWKYGMPQRTHSNPMKKMFTCYEKHGDAYKSMLFLFHECLFIETKLELLSVMTYFIKFLILMMYMIFSSQRRYRFL